MKNCFLLRRSLVLLLTAIILWTLLTFVFYSFVAQPVFTRIKAREFLPRAEKLIEECSLTSSEFISPFFSKSVKNSFELYGNWMFVVNGAGEIVLETPLPPELTSLSEEIYTLVIKEHNRSREYEEHNHFVKARLSNTKYNLMVMTVPITNKNMPDVVFGNLVIVQPLEAMAAGIQSLNFALITSAIIVFVIMLVPIILATLRVFRPLDDIRKVAQAITAGDFKQRAAEIHPGEIGEFAKAFNNMADNLSTLFEELQEQKNNLQQIIDGIAEGILAVDRQGNVTYHNKRLWAVFGLHRSLSADYSPQRFLSTSRIDKFFQTAITEHRMISNVISKDHRQIACTITPVKNEQGVVNSAVGLFRDVTEVERLEHTRRDYIANISHELRTPLTSMRALLEPLSEGMVKSEEVKQRYYQTMLHETLRLSRLIDDMLELSRIQAETVIVEQCPTDANLLLNEIIMRYTPMAEQKGIRLVLAIEPCFPEIWTNADRCEQILIILLDNALKFTPRDGQVTLTLEHTVTGKAAISVSDTGPGIAPEDIDHVFDRFFKADRAHTYVGTGLGLSIAHEIAQLMGQELTVRSEPGKGAIFTLTLDFASDILQSVAKLKDVYDSETVVE